MTYWSIQLYNVDACFILSASTLCLVTHNISVGCIIGTGIFSTPSSILSSVNSVGASLMLWVLGFVLSFSGLFVWLEVGTMISRSGYTWRRCLRNPIFWPLLFSP
jgi:Amino acid permease